MATYYRNWIEAAVGKQIAFAPTYVGKKGGRAIYAVAFEDGTEEDYFIDYDRKEIERY